MKSKIPTLKTREEVAEFWDTHDIGDFMDELEIVKGVYNPEPSGEEETLSLRVPVSLKKRVKRIAKSYHISMSALLRIWMMEKLDSSNGTV